ncbi:MAG: restriction endonuclease subunit S [Leptospirales bacterium]|nr:restriction endonuclease subunit S [Leptospirales bacterium]
MKDWREMPLGEVVTLKRGHDLPAKDRKPGNIPIFSSSGISGYHDEPILPGPGVITGRYGTIGDVFLSRGPYWPLNTTLYVIEFNGNDEVFIYYFLKQVEWEKFNDKSAVPGVNRNDVHREEVLLPPLPEQKSIASVLSSLDDKIDLLHRQNKTLESMAETLFRQWFVEEADEGWEQKRLGDFFSVRTGKQNANFSTEDGPYPFFTCSQTTLRAPDYSFEGSAILLAGNGDFNIKRYSGKFEVYQRTYVLIPYEVMWYDFLYVYMKYYLDEITGGHRGSVINFITKGMIEEQPVPVPADALEPKLEYFRTLFTKVDANTHQIETLEGLRDTLLPKLMSGEVRVSATANLEKPTER